MPAILKAAALAELDARLAEQARRLEQERDDGRQAAGATPAGDVQRLRGIPALARGVQGALAGTRP